MKEPKSSYIRNKTVLLSISVLILIVIKILGLIDSINE